MQICGSVRLKRYSAPCPENRKVAYATFMLIGEAEVWWQGLQSMVAAREEELTWESFKELFLGKFFPPSARLEKERIYRIAAGEYECL